MKYAIEYESEALVGLERLTPVIRERVVSKIEWLAENLDRIIPQQLTGNLASFYKLRISDYRVIYDFSTEETVLRIDRVGHRSEIYG